MLLIQRHLTHTVDGIVGEIDDLRHTVLGTLQHHTTAEHTAEVGTLDAVHQTTGIHGQHTALLPVVSTLRRVGYPVVFFILNKDGVISLILH